MASLSTWEGTPLRVLLSRPSSATLPQVSAPRVRLKAGGRGGLSLCPFSPQGSLRGLSAHFLDDYVQKCPAWLASEAAGAPKGSHLRPPRSQPGLRGVVFMLEEPSGSQQGGSGGLGETGGVDMAVAQPFEGCPSRAVCQPCVPCSGMESGHILAASGEQGRGWEGLRACGRRDTGSATVFPSCAPHSTLVPKTNRVHTPAQ